ncbi:MerR family transcriptional regulator [Bacillus cereus]|uniref:MerR family transcriptional regulator n=1 Tax=Bacillus TaxID=1386 RepID=UPI0009E04059|nr:MerR family transcriptional regulator [Bacillus sp. UNC322MFChir4.1]
MYRIGQLAHMAHVSKRTIDYYTNLGILKAERSQSNYRYYDETAIETLRFIERCKEMHIPLSEIKDRIEEKTKLLGVNENVSEQVNDVTERIHRLETELVELKPLLDGLTDSQREKLTKHLSTQTTALIQSLILLL